MRRIFVFFLFMSSLCTSTWGRSLPLSQQTARTASLKGRVVDARTGEPIAKVKVIVSGAHRSTSTDASGDFALRDLEPGEIELYLTAVGYGLVKRTTLLKEGENTEGQIALHTEAATLTDKVTIATRPYEEAESNAVSEHHLNKSELQKLALLLVGDPLRAAQALPGVTANNDLRSDFAVRGAGFNRIGIFVDGVLTDGFVHRLAERGTTDELSLSVINQDALSEVTLMSGAFPVKYGDSSAAVLKLETREGNRVRPTGRFSTGLLTTSGVVDGPLANGRGSWLLAARTSYIDQLQQWIEHITGTGQSETNQDENGDLDFTDVQGKAVYDLSSRNQLGISTMFGIFRANQGEQNRILNLHDPNEIDESDSRNLLINAHWNYSAGAKLLAQTRIFLLRTPSESINQDRQILERRQQSQFGLRHDLSLLAPHQQHLEAGVYLRSVTSKKTSNFFTTLPPAPQTFEDFSRQRVDRGYYAQDTWTSEQHRLSVTLGARVEHFGLTGETKFSPRAAVAWSPGEKWRIRAGTGRYYQAPDVDRLLGLLGNPALRAERASHYNASVERTFGTWIRALIEVYDREDRDLTFSLWQPRIEMGGLTTAAFPYQNELRGHARGIEMTLQRRSANGLSGWISYAFAKTRLQNESGSLSFVSDFDQRHTMNAFASYRFTGTLDLSGQWRYGSGTPIPAFLRTEGAGLVFASERNLARVPAYSRLDVRVNKAFLFKKWKLTLSGEVLNLLNHKNEYVVESNLIRYRATGSYLLGLRESFRILPSIGIAFEF